MTDEGNHFSLWSSFGCSVLLKKGKRKMGNKNREVKRKARRKQYERERNVAKNQKKIRYRLDVLWPEGWKTMGGFHNAKQVNNYVAEQEDIRLNNESDILEGRIFDVDTGKMVARIAPHKKDPDGIDEVKRFEPQGFVGDIVKDI